MKKLRPPIVTVLGHVDHGKTTLLDAVRKTKVATKEAGGITQRIGASVVTTKENKKITFIDTPGHVAFSSMRSRGAKVADIAILVVAADDGVKPQTKEALKHIIEAEIPYIVAITKIDLPTADVNSVRRQLEKIGVLFEGRGGQVPQLAVSGKTGKEIEALLEMVVLVAEVNEIKADSQGDLEAVVIETSKDKRGPLVSAVVRNGTLQVAQKIVADGVPGKVKGLFNDEGKSIKQVIPGHPGQILGFGELPPVGSRVRFLGEEKKIQKEEKRALGKEVGEDQIPFIIKTQTRGSLEAILENLPEKAVVIFSGIGGVNESDIFLAKPAGAYILAFETKASSTVAKLARTEEVSIEKFDVIYKLFEKIEELIKKSEKEVLGKAQILASFPYSKKKVAGCKVVSGKITKTKKLILMRDEKELGEAKIVSMKKEKQKIIEAKEGEEFGVILEPQLDFKTGDMLVSVAQ